MYPNQNPYLNNFNPYMNNATYNNYSPLSGRFVPDFGSITANDVPMAGQPAIFPKDDLSEIEVRKWSAMGKIERTLYLPVKANEDIKTTTSSTNEFESLESAFKRVVDPFENRLSNIETMLFNQNLK